MMQQNNNREKNCEADACKKEEEKLIPYVHT